MGTKKRSLAENFMELINPTPESFDPEDDLHPDTVAKVVKNEDCSSEEERFLSTFRKRNAELIEEGNERYIGAKISRKALRVQKGDSEFHESDEKSSLSASETEHSSDDVSEVNSYENEEDNQDESNETPHSEDRESDSNFQHISSKHTSTELEVEKGNAVRHQLNLWDNLLECRIQLQKTLNAANKLPYYNIFQQFTYGGGSKFKAEVRHAERSVAVLLEKLINFQKKMLKSYPETRNLNKKIKTADSVKEMEEEICSDTEDEELSSDAEDNTEVQAQKEDNIKHRKVEDYSQALAEQHKQYIDYRNAIIQKWNDKTRISIGKFSSRNFSNFEQSALKQIEQILSNRQRLIQRSQLKRSSYNILGHELVTQQMQEESEKSTNVETDQEQSKEYCTEIFDDADFYHQLLRELIERKSSDITDPVQLGRQWLELQKLRSKMKRKIDTRATKGRKIRYAVHPKLVNFTAPVTWKLWNEDAKTELYNSLFGCNSRR